jgi:hypothetical protein
MSGEKLYAMRATLCDLDNVVLGQRIVNVWASSREKAIQAVWSTLNDSTEIAVESEPKAERSTLIRGGEQKEETK